MAEKQREMGNILQVVSRARGHADWTAFSFSPGDGAKYGRRRINSIENALKKAFDKLARIRDLAMRQGTGNEELLEIFAEMDEVLPVHD